MLPVQNLLPIYGNISAQIFVLIIIFLNYIQIYLGPANFSNYSIGTGISRYFYSK